MLNIILLMENHNRLKIGMHKNKKVYVVMPQFGHSRIIITPRKKSVCYCNAWISVGGISFNQDWFDLTPWTAEKIEIKAMV